MRNDLATLANHVREQFSVIATAGPHLQNDIAGLNTQELEYGCGQLASKNTSLAALMSRQSSMPNVPLIRAVGLLHGYKMYR